MKFPPKLQIELYNPAIPLQSIYSKEKKTLTQKGICIPMFTAALFTIAKIWTQCKVSINLQTYKENVVQIYNGTLFYH